MQPAGRTIESLLAARKGASGFDYLRLVLALAVLAFHCMTVTQGAAGDHYIWSAWWRGANALVLPMFFAMSGFLLAANLDRSNAAEFLLGRVLRLGPALVVAVVLTALVLGPAVTRLSLEDYLYSQQFWRYFLNILGWTQATLPGVFAHNPMPDFVNLPLWTLPYQLIGYAALLAAGYVGLTRRGLTFLGMLLVLHVLVAARDWVRPDQLAVFEEVPPKLLVLTFMYGVAMHSLRNRITLSHGRAALALIVSVLLLSFPAGVYMAPLPVAYATIYLGCTTLPRIWLVRKRDLSYGVYLFAFPMQQLAILFEPSLTPRQIFLLAVPLALLAAALSYHCVEKPCMDWRKSIRFGASRPALT